MKSNANKMAFVLAGGGSLGAVQVGMLAALTEAGVVPDLVVGASVGAINALYYAFHPTQRGVGRLRSLWGSIGRADVFPLSPWSAFQGLRGRQNGLVPNHGLRRTLRKAIGNRALEDSRIECHVIAADAVTGDRVLLSRGNAVSALLASAAIPGVFEPVELDGRLLFDGGIAANTPIRAAVEGGARTIVVLPTGCQSSELPAGPVAISLHALQILIGRQLYHDIEALRHLVDLRIVPPLCPSPMSVYDFSRSDDAIRSAHVHTRRWIQSGGLERSEIPMGLIPTCPLPGGDAPQAR